MTLNFFLYTVNCSLNNYLQDLWSEMAISLKLLNLRTHEYRLQLTAKASIDTYIYTSGTRAYGRDFTIAVEMQTYTPA